MSKIGVHIHMRWIIYTMETAYITSYSWAYNIHFDPPKKKTHGNGGPAL